jgi:hypothetical protein
MNELLIYSRILRVGIDSRGADGFARSLVSCLSEELGLRAALLYGLEPSGSLRLRDSHGFIDAVTQAFHAPGLFENLPMGRAIRTASTVVMTDKEVFEAVPRVERKSLPFELYVHVPCRSLDSPVGGIALAFSGRHSGKELPASLFRVLATVGAARLRHLSSPEPKAA